MRKSGHFQVWTLLAVLAALASQAHAEEISFKATGTVNTVTGFGGNVAVNDPITFCYTFESTTPDKSHPLNTKDGIYSAGMLAATVETGALSMSSSAHEAGDVLTVEDPGTPFLIYSVTKRGLSGSGFAGVSVEMVLRNPTSPMFSSDALPLEPFDALVFRSRTMTVRDSAGNVLRATVDSLELCGDSTPPVVAATTAKASLAQPNHKFVDVGLSVEVDDDQDANPAVKVFVFSNEPAEDDTGDGSPEPDAIIGPDSLDLRAVRKGNGNGRVYLIVVAATDESGNMGYTCCTVTVPHDQSKKSKDAVASEALGIEMLCEFLEATIVEELLSGLDELGLHRVGN